LDATDCPPRRAIPKSTSVDAAADDDDEKLSVMVVEDSLVGLTATVGLAPPSCC